MLLICMSHSPLMVAGVQPTDAEKHEGFYSSIADCAKMLADYRPELVVLFGPDHFHWLFYDLMPAFCIGFEAESNRDWHLPAARLNVPSQLGLACARHVQRAGVDVSISYRMRVDHGMTIPLLKLTGSLERYPVLPVMINCIADPRPSLKRVRALAEAVGAFLGTLDTTRVAVIGSGGLSHDPPAPRMATAPIEVKNQLIDRHTYTKEEYELYQQGVIEACRLLAQGESPILPPDAAWDKKFIALLLQQKLEAFDDWGDDDIEREGGFGGHEIRCWLAAFAAMKGAGTFTAAERFHAVIPEWGTGMAVVAGMHHPDAPAAARA